MAFENFCNDSISGKFSRKKYNYILTSHGKVYSKHKLFIVAYQSGININCGPFATCLTTIIDFFRSNAIRASAAIHNSNICGTLVSIAAAITSEEKLASCLRYLTTPRLAARSSRRVVFHDSAIPPYQPALPNGQSSRNT